MVALGYVADDALPDIINSCDLLVAMNIDSSFGQYSYPVKIYEALACGKQVLASATQPVRWILQEDERLLASIGNVGDLAARITSLLDQPVEIKPLENSWSQAGLELESMLRKL